MKKVGLLFVITIVISLLSINSNNNIAPKGPFNNSISPLYKQAYAENIADLTSNANSTTMNFTKAVNLSNNTEDSVYGQVAASGRNLYIVWEDSVSIPPATVNNNTTTDNDEPNYDIFIKKSVDGGETFSKKINLSNNQGFSEHPQISAYGNNVYVVWTDDSFGNKEIFFRKSADTGETFSKTISLDNNGSKISSSGGGSSNEEIAAYGDSVYVVWQRQLEDQQRKEGPTANDVNHSSIVFRASADAGSTFDNAKILTNNATNLSYPKVAATSSGDHNIMAYVVWSAVKPLEHKSNIDEGIFFTKSTDNGNSFSSIAKINGNARSVGESQLAAYGNNVYIVWAGIPDFKIEGDIYFTKSTDEGNSFLTNPVSLGENNALNVEVASNLNNVYVAWQGVVVTADDKDNEEIFVKRSIDYGDTFTRNATDISNNDGVSECVSIALSGKNSIYLVWEDNTPGNHEILYSKNNVVL